MLSVVAGRHGGPESCVEFPPTPLSPAGLRGCATGTFPGTIPLRVADYQRGLGRAGADILALAHIAAADGHAVLNTSLGCIPEDCGDVAEMSQQARAWIEKVRGADLEDRFVHLTSAGNVESEAPDLTDASTAGHYAAAALLPGLQEADGTPVPNLSNVLVIENVVNTDEAPYAPMCLAAGSKYPGNLAAIGTNVFGLTDAASTVESGSGTSFSSPQTAGLAAYVWALAPELTVEQVRTLLVATTSGQVASNEEGCATPFSAPVIDAYAAVLALDEAVLPTPETALVRAAILDATRGGTFEEVDVEFCVIEYIEGFVDAATHGAPREPAAPDYGNCDFNGDGFTGGTTLDHRRAFDLDRVGSTQYGPSQLTRVLTSVQGEARLFDENALTDMESLCYYAYSPLYAGDPAARDGLIDPDWCDPLRVETLLPAQVVPATPVPLSVRVERLVKIDQGGEVREPLEGLVVELTPMNGSVADPSGTTDVDGFFDTQVTLLSAPPLVIDVVVREPDGGVILAEDTVQATAELVIVPDEVVLAPSGRRSSQPSCRAARPTPSRGRPPVERSTRAVSSRPAARRGSSPSPPPARSAGSRPWRPSKSSHRSSP